MRAATPGANVPAVRRVPMVGSQGMMLLDYLGEAERETFYGRQSGARYVAGTDRPVILIDSQDKDTMLAMVDSRGKSLFMVHTIEVSIDARTDNPVDDPGGVPDSATVDAGQRATGDIRQDAGLVRKTRRPKRGVAEPG